MNGSLRVVRLRQSCARCGQTVLEYFRSPDGHYGLAQGLKSPGPGEEVRCPTCGARYRLLERLNALGQPVVRAEGRQRKSVRRKKNSKRG